jgi:hypothetical protein
VSESGRSVPGSGPRRGAARRGECRGGRAEVNGEEGLREGGRRDRGRDHGGRGRWGKGGGLGIGGEGDDEVAVSLYDFSFPFFLSSFFLEFRLDRDGGGRDSVDLVFGPDGNGKGKRGAQPKPQSGGPFRFPGFAHLP